MMKMIPCTAEVDDDEKDKEDEKDLAAVHDSCDGSEPQVHEAPGNPFSRLSSNPPAQTWAQGTPLKVKSQETFEG